MTKLAIIYYSATGTGENIARRAEEAATKVGAEVRRRHVAESAPPEAVASNPQWQAHREAVKAEPVATPDDLVWADAVLFGSPTRYGTRGDGLSDSYKRVNPGQPFRREGLSGYGREMGFEAMREYSEPKATWVNVDAQIPPFYPR